MECSYSFLLFSLFLLVCIQSLIRWLTKKRKLPPGPTGLPFIGNLLAIGDRPHESLAKLAKTHGPLMTVQLGFNTTIVASSADMVREVLQKNDQAFLGRPIPHAVQGGTGEYLSLAWLQGSSQEWKTLRKLSNSQIFTPKRLDALQDLRHQMMDAMVRSVAEASEAGEAVHIGRLVFGTALNSLSKTMFSVDMMDANSDEIQELKDLVGRIMVLAGKPNLADYFPFLKPFDPSQIVQNIKVSYDRLHELMDDMISRRLNRRESGFPRTGDFLDVLFDQSEQHGADQLTVRQIKALLTDLFIGGTDTISTTLEWVMAELLRHPDIMAKTKQELHETIGLGQTIKEKDIPRLPYLDSLLKESMRLHPTAPLLIPHLTETDAQVCGYTIPKNTQVLVNSWAISRDPAYWDQPNHFIPERFLDSKVDFRGTNFSYTPFGTGRRICPGLNLAVRMLSLLLGSLLHHFDWKLPDGMAPQDLDMKDKFGVTLQKAVPLVVIPTKN